MPTKKIQIIGGSFASDVSWSDVKDKPALIKSGSQTTISSESGGENIYTFTNTDGETSTFIVKNGTQGNDGASVTVLSVSESSVDGGNNVITFSDGNTLTIKNGTQGGVGETGADGTSVAIVSVNESTADGGNSVVTFSDGNTLSVKNGSKGSDGHTPVRGTDYWTEADKAEIKSYVDEAILGGAW